MIATNNKLRIGLLGGTFDPIHLGHLLPAQEIAQLLMLDSIHIMPAHVPPHKTKTTASTEHRVAMAKLACQSDSIFQLDLRELKRQGKSYTVDTLSEIKQQYPNSQLFFFMGMDSLLNFTKWYQWQKILTLTNLVVTERPHYHLSSANQETQMLINQHTVENQEQLTADYGQIIFIHNQQIDISSTELREKLKLSNQSNPWLLASVSDYITKHQLYQSY